MRLSSHPSLPPPPPGRSVELKKLGPWAFGGYFPCIAGKLFRDSRLHLQSPVQSAQDLLRRLFPKFCWFLRIHNPIPRDRKRLLLKNLAHAIFQSQTSLKSGVSLLTDPSWNLVTEAFTVSARKSGPNTSEIRFGAPWKLETHCVET